PRHIITIDVPTANGIGSDDPGGVEEISRWLSAAKPPGCNVRTCIDPEGVAERGCDPSGETVQRFACRNRPKRGYRKDRRNGSRLSSVVPTRNTKRGSLSLCSTWMRLGVASSLVTRFVMSKRSLRSTT